MTFQEYVALGGIAVCLLVGAQMVALMFDIKRGSTKDEI